MSKPKRSSPGPIKVKIVAQRSAQVVDLEQVREARQRAMSERRVRKVLEENRFTLKGLFASGLIFTQKGSRAGRDLLGAQLALLKLIDLIARTLGEGDGGDDGDRFSSAAQAAVFGQLDAQLARTAQLTARCGEFIAGRSSE